VVYGKKHDGVLLVHPGSPTLPNNLVGLGTVGLMEVKNGQTNVQIISLDD